MALPFVASNLPAQAAPRDLTHGSATVSGQYPGAGPDMAQVVHIADATGLPSLAASLAAVPAENDQAVDEFSNLGLANQPNSADPAFPQDPNVARGNDNYKNDAHLNGALSSEFPQVSCLARTICAIKDRIRWQTAAWTPTECNKIATAVLTSSKRYSISPSLLLAVMINESDLNEKAARITMRENKVYAKDSGLMAVRCVLDRRSRCLNGNVRGVAWSALMDPTTNIAAGARELAYWRSGGAVVKKVVKVRDASGKLRPIFKNVPCHHTDHAYWAHYNHGPFYIAKGYARHYPHRVAVLDHALATALNVDAPELRATHITIHDAGKRERTADRPVEARYRKLCSQIESVGACSAVALN
ncbi:MAG: transglycosylase SLT domain-containing protein [Myxococcales bacterium]